MPAALLLVVFVPMLIEARRAARNERVQRRLGGVEAPEDVYPIMRVAYPASFLAMIVEGAIGGSAAPAWLAGGAIVFAAAKALKWWAILTLGRFWTFRVVAVPDTVAIVAGPYRFVRHPNYVGVMGELAGVGLMAGARIAGPIATVAFGVLILRRIRIEERWLDAILRRP